VFAFQAFGKTFVVLPKLVGVGGIVVRHHDGIVADANVAFQARQQRLGEMIGVPSRIRLAK